MTQESLTDVSDERQRTGKPGCRREVEEESEERPESVVKGKGLRDSPSETLSPYTISITRYTGNRKGKECRFLKIIMPRR